MSTSRLLLGLALLASTGCGDDSQAGGGGTPGDTSGNGDTTSAESSTSATSATSSNASSSASTSAATTSSATTSSSATSSSTGEPGLCAWAGVDPGNLVATGNAIGDVIENVSGLVDQCGVPRALWDFAGGYRILSMTPGW